MFCFLLVLGLGCSQTSKIPKGMSPEFYKVMTYLEGLIQKSIDTGYNYLHDEKYITKYGKQMVEYFYISTMNDVVSEDIKKMNKQMIEELSKKGYNFNIALSEIEKFTYNAFMETSILLDEYLKEPEKYKTELVEKHNKLKQLLKP
jgi:hypothetical protein